ncbi:FtsX-like permease family protein [Ruminococcus sp.]|uniref:ABC transporter permease n=1 Tax=Ruminococcus sp. TaxID=41978 RepID=UPI0025E5B87D|nr:FtsX-like permease family protein [Ruminococcus sp.]
MRLIFKHTLKNIWAHKLRTILLLICIAVCSFTAMLCFDMSGSLDKMVKSMFANMAGNTDLIISTKSPIEEGFADGAPDCDIMYFSGGSCYFDRHLDMDISYVRRKQVNIFAIDAAQAKKMKLVKNDLELGDKKAAISEEFSKEFGYKKGDKIVLHGERDIPVEFTVSSVEKKQGIFDVASRIAISLDDMKDLVIADEPEIMMAFVDVKNDSEVKEAEDFFKKKYPTAEVDNFFDNEELNEQIGSITRIFLVLFAICMLLVIFVTVSVCERMIVDKMSVVGTFRSLGISSRITTVALLFENILYGLIGSVIGVVLYSYAKQPFFDSMFTFSSNGEDTIHPDVPKAKLIVIIGVILGAMIVECLCPIKEVIKAVKTPIRDIIFDTKDTEYRPSRTGTYIGFGLLAVSAVTYFFKDHFWGGMICFVCFIAAVGLLYNYIYRFAARLLEKLFEKLGFPIARLAAVEAGAKKCTVGSSVLCVTAASLAMVIYIFTNSISAVYNHSVFKSDVIAMIGGSKASYLSYVKDLEGVDKSELIYFTWDDAKINNDEKETQIAVYGWKDGGYELLDAFSENPEIVGDGEVLLDKVLMKKHGLKTGDTIKINFNSDGYLPVEEELKIAGRIEYDYYAGSGTSVVISEKHYKELFGDYPSNLIVTGNDAKALKDTIKDHSADYINEIYTHEEFDQYLATERASLNMILTLLICIGIGLTFIGVVSNQLIGLEGRKRECAVMTSVAMPRKKLSKMFLIESFIAALIALVAAVPIGIFMSHIFMGIMEQLEMFIPLEISVAACIKYALILCAVFTLVSLFPIRALKKMDIVSQLKYE